MKLQPECKPGPNKMETINVGASKAEKDEEERKLSLPAALPNSRKSPLLSEVSEHLLDRRRLSTSYSSPDLANSSLVLKNVLDHAGFSEIARAGRMTYNITYHTHETIQYAIIGFGHRCSLAMGSSVEGTFLPNTLIDLVVINYLLSVKVYGRTENINETLGVVMSRDESTPAGYYKLQPTYKGSVIVDRHDIHLRKYEQIGINVDTDAKDIVVLNHFEMDKDADAKHGPAITFQGRANRCDRDIVECFMCEDTVTEMDEWCSRDRKYDWPSQQTRHLFRDLGCFLVPVGHPLSRERHLEWRVSFSLQERHLMRHLNSTQYHCFMLLKLIKKILIKPKFGDVLTSYQCKTLLFYTMEHHKPEIWVSENLITCLKMCLDLLYNWISDRYIPNYFIPGENMFVKMNEALKDSYYDLKLYLKGMCSCWTFLLMIPYNDFGLLFLKKLDDTSADKNIEICDYFILAMQDLGMLMHSFPFSDGTQYVTMIKVTLDYLDAVLDILKFPKPGSRYKTFEENIVQLYRACFDRLIQKTDTSLQFSSLIDLYRFPIEDTERDPRIRAIEAMKSAIQRKLGSALAARYFHTHESQLLLESNKCLDLSKSLEPVTGMLVKASVLLKQSLYIHCDTLLAELERVCKELPLSCACYEHGARYLVPGAHKQLHGCWTEFGSGVFEGVNVWVSLRCLRFDIYELNVVPAALRFDAYRTFGSPVNMLSMWEDRWCDSVTVDTVMYMYYLQYLTNRHHNPGEATVALCKMETTLFDRLERWSMLGHSETWLNILGDIFLKKGWLQPAWKCFKHSYKLRPQHNAVKWHVMFRLFSPTGGGS